MNFAFKRFSLVFGVTMLVHVEINRGLVRKDSIFSPTTFRDLDLKESDLEEFIRNNVEILFASEDGEETASESLLIVGQQVANVERGRSDLIAVDGRGRLVLIEIKRDLDDITHRKEPFEFQAIRYAASLATVKTQEQLLEAVYGPYIEKHRNNREFIGYEGLTATEIGKRKLDEFLSLNNALETFNQKQRIMLLSSEFDNQTLSAVSWLIANGVDISCFTLTPGRLLDQLFIKVIQILPLTSLEDNYVNLRSESNLTSTRPQTSGSSGTRRYLPRIPTLFEWGILKRGDVLFITDHQNSEAEALSKTNVRYRDEELSYNEWGKRVTGWSSLNIYLFAVHKERGKTLYDLRAEKMEQLQAQAQQESPIT